MHLLHASSTVYKPDLAWAWADSGLGRGSRKGYALGIANGQRTHAVQAVDTFHAPDNVLGYDLAGPLNMPGFPGFGHGSGIACASGFKNAESSICLRHRTSYFAQLSPMGQASMCFRNRTPFRHRCELGLAYVRGIHIFRASDGSSYRAWLVIE